MFKSSVVGVHVCVPPSDDSATISNQVGMSMILLISSPTDEHASTVFRELVNLRKQAILLDLSQFPQQMQLTMHLEDADFRQYGLRLADKTWLNLADCQVIWWRRPQQFVLHPEISKQSYCNFAFNESYEAFAGLWQSLPVLWVNHPTKDEVAHRKTFQLRIAQEVGLTIPKTLITNDVDQARQFIATQGYDRTIYKAFSATQQEWRETRLLKQEELDLLDNVRYAPVIFQEYIEAQYDLRITIVGQEIFAAAIHSQSTAYKVDMRMDIAHAQIEAVQLPTEIEAKLHALMQRLGLVYGAIDMRLTPDGQYVFLEINPAGQWLFIEQYSKQPITTSLAKLLAKASVA
jgi:glutathione synthase/RimK-type ligase-like ATP-grasp enzyme